MDKGGVFEDWDVTEVNLQLLPKSVTEPTIKYSAKKTRKEKKRSCI